MLATLEVRAPHFKEVRPDLCRRNGGVSGFGGEVAAHADASVTVVRDN
jgi:hypothetical protein